jgi:hypothetical protein
MLKRHLVILGLYLVLALGMTFPLVLHFGDHVPGTTTWSMDEYGYVWNNWWFKHAVFDLGQNPFQTNYLFYPIGTSLVLYTFTLLHVLLGLPIQLLFGLIPASNAELCFAFVFSGYGTFLVSSYLLRDWKSEAVAKSQREMAAFAAGVVFAFASNRLVYASLGHYNVVATEWIPFYLLFLIKTLRERRWSNALLAGLFAALALYVETTDGVLLLLLTALYLAFAWRRTGQPATWARLTAMTVVAAVLFSPLLVPTVYELLRSGYALPGWGHAEKLLVDLAGWFTPTSLHPLNRRWVEELDLVRQGVSRFADVNTVFVGFVTFGLAALAAVRFGRRVFLWVGSACFFALLSLGPLLHVNGQSVFDLDGLQVTFPLPFLLLHYIPLLRENRVPNRFSVLVMLSLAILVGFAVLWVIAKTLAFPLSRRLKERLAILIAGILIALLLFEHLAVPLPLTDARVPGVYEQIAREPGDFTILTLPLGWRNSFGQQGAEDTRTQYYQTAHSKFIFPGNIQRNPPFLFGYFDRIPLFHSLTELEFYRDVGEEAQAQDRAAAPGLMAFFDVRYVVIHPSIPGRPPYSDTRAAVADYVRKVLPLGDMIYDRDGLVAYRVNQPPLPDKARIDFGTRTAHPYQAEGWDRDELISDLPANWANRSKARLFLPVRQVADYGLTVRALPFTYPGSPPQTMQVSTNGQPVQQFQMKPGWDSYTVVIPAGLLHSGLNDIVLQFGYVVRPHDVLPAQYGIGTTEVHSPVDIVVNSSALGSIKVDGREVSLLGRGYNVAVVDPASGRVLAAKVFNTADDRAQSRAMTEFIGGLPNGVIVAVAAQEEVAASLGDNTVKALHSIGASIDIRKTPGRSHAIIGVRGASAGSAQEQSSEGTSFISVGHSPDERTLAAAVSSVTYERRP